MGETGEPPSPSAANSQYITFNYVWPLKVSLRTISADDSVILHVSPKFATVHDHVSFVWSLKIHGTTGGLCSEDELDSEYSADNVPDPANYVAVELYYVDGPVSQICIQSGFQIAFRDGSDGNSVEESKVVHVTRGCSQEMTDSDRLHISEFLQENVGNSLKVSLTLQMDAKLFDPFYYLDAMTPTPQKSFLTTNYKARVNSKIWRKRQKRDEKAPRIRIPRHEKIDYEERFRRVMEENDAEHQMTLTRDPEKADHRKSIISLRRSSNATNPDQSWGHEPEHEHIFKKLLIACCDSCRQRRDSAAISNPEATDPEQDDADDEDDEPPGFECKEQNQEHVHDLLANMYFNKIVLPHMEFVEDFVDFLIDAELNELPVLKRACERYLCGELNLKKELATSLILDLLFLSMVFNLPVMKSMTLSELSCDARVEELSNPERMLQHDEFKKLDRRMRLMSDLNVVSLVEECRAFREQRLRVIALPLLS